MGGLWKVVYEIVDFEGEDLEILETFGGCDVHGSSYFSCDASPILIGIEVVRRLRICLAFAVVVVVGNLSLQFVNSYICILRLGLGVKGGLVYLYIVGGAPRIQSMYSCSRTWHLHLDR